MFAQLAKFLDKGLNNRLPLVAYRKPGDAELTLVLQHNRDLNYLEDYASPGFIFAPFNPLSRALRLSPDTLERIELPDTDIQQGVNIPVINEKAEEQKAYVQLVQAAQDKIKQGLLRKVVLSRTLQPDFRTNPVTAFKVLLQMYPSAFCYFWYHPEVGMWMGASPELLIGLDGNDFHTVALAGTQKYSGSSQIEWGQKEQEEQELVTRYIEEVLRDKVSSLRVTEARTFRAGDLLHLESRINGTIHDIGLQQLLSLLHPTPAVCGWPRDESLRFLRQNEGYDRRFYTGYLGELNMHKGKQQAQIYVNLRCMSFSRKRATIYVGGGITADSSPGAEWQETKDKANTMLKVLLYSTK